ncbi:cytochrome P450 89A2-like [Papaver somniferum]|uniref:cytochrome P450 89A2-like n=1 Tax=Papaver somniferum TaxID=3469 RepID=UPI000E6F648C|nr:cytochrome P450 89A2-like [Papaver somniferum]
MGWLLMIIITVLSLCAITLINLLLLRQTRKRLPPGPVSIPIITTLQWLRKPSADVEPTLRNLKAKYGPIITLSFGYQKIIFISNSSLTHQALIQNGAIFADRPPAPLTSKIVSSDQHVISEASGPLWRLLRKNLTVQILHPSKFKSFAPVRKRVLNIIKESIKKESNSGQNPVLVVDHLQFGMFCLLVFMCFGEKLDEEKIRQVESVQRNLLLGLSRLEILNFFPEFVSKIVFRKIWQDFDNLKMDHENVLIPLIRSRQELIKKTSSGNHHDDQKSCLGFCYVDSLLNLEIPDEEGGSRKLTEKEVVSLCREFLDAGTDTTTTALEWIMANLVKYQDIQSKLYDEIRKISDDDDDEIQEEDLKKLPYLKAVVLEGLRRHPPGHFVLNHAVTQDVGLDGYVVPKEAVVNFMVAEIGRDTKVWGEDSMVFKPERFLNDGSVNGELSDLTGNKEIKMIPFGTGRRICPASGLAMLILEYFVANLIKEFKWTPKAGDDIDLSEKQDFITMVMKNPLWAHVSPTEHE